MRKLSKYDMNFINTFWRKFNLCRSEQDYANLITWIYSEAEKSSGIIPITETIAQIWEASPSSMNNFIRQGGPVAALFLSASRDEVKYMSKEELAELKQAIMPTNGLSLMASSSQFI